MFQWKSKTDSLDRYLLSIYYVLHTTVSTRHTAQSSEQNNQKSLMGEIDNKPNITQIVH